MRSTPSDPSTFGCDYKESKDGNAERAGGGAVIEGPEDPGCSQTRVERYLVRV
jgi:hypothetical protein